MNHHVIPLHWLQQPLFLPIFSPRPPASKATHLCCHRSHMHIWHPAFTALFSHGDLWVTIVPASAGCCLVIEHAKLCKTSLDTRTVIGAFTQQATVTIAVTREAHSVGYSITATPLRPVTMPGAGMVCLLGSGLLQIWGCCRCAEPLQKPRSGPAALAAAARAARCLCGEEGCRGFW